MDKILILSLILLNTYTFILMGSDKKRAKKRGRRVPEARFFWLAFFGGALGVFLGMSRFRHKTLHNSFRVGIPLLVVWNAAAAAFLLARIV